MMLNQKNIRNIGSLQNTICCMSHADQTIVFRSTEDQLFNWKYLQQKFKVYKFIVQSPVFCIFLTYNFFLN